MQCSVAERIALARRTKREQRGKTTSETDASSNLGVAAARGGRVLSLSGAWCAMMRQRACRQRVRKVIPTTKRRSPDGGKAFTIGSRLCNSGGFKTTPLRRRMDLSLTSGNGRSKHHPCKAPGHDGSRWQWGFIYKGQCFGLRTCSA